MNGYFQLELRKEGTYLLLFPPTDGGEPVSYTEVSRYLTYINLTDYNAKKLKDLLSQPEEGDGEINTSLEEPTDFLLGAKRPYEETGMMLIFPSEDRMHAIARFYPPSTEGAPLTDADIRATLQREKVKYGILDDAIAAFLENPVYCSDYEVATGDPITPGTHASIEYFFEIEKNLAPALNEDGTVNYHELNQIAHVRKGDLLARLTPAVEGKPGKNIYGDNVLPPSVNRLKLKHGKNITLSEDQTELYSDVDGHAALVKDQVFVSDVYTVPANVDNSIGDVEFQGSVDVKGNVNSGFTVKAGGDIVVTGVVEGAVLEAGGKIIVKGGVHGMSKAILRAGGSITVKFIENAEVYSEESINTDSIMHSKVSAKFEIRVKGKKGFISGGKIWAGSKIVTQTLGSDMGATTQIEVGLNTKMKKQMHDLEERQKELEQEKAKIEPTLTGIGEKVARGMELPEDKMAFLKSVAVAYRDIQEELSENLEAQSELQEDMERSQRACIEVMGDLYPGCMVTISGAQRSMNNRISACKLVKDGVDVKII